MSDRFAEFQDGYVELVKSCVDRWDQALNDVRRRRYSPQGLLSDLLGYWTDVASFSATFATSTSDLPPNVTLTVDPTKPTAVSAVSVDEDQRTQFATFDLVRTDGGPETIPRDKILVNLFDEGKVLVVQLVDLDKLPGGPLKPGEYSREIKDAASKRVVASVTVTVR